MKGRVQGRCLENNGLQGSWQRPAPVTCGRVCGSCSGVLLAERVGNLLVCCALKGLTPFCIASGNGIALLGNRKGLVQGNGPLLNSETLATGGTWVAVREENIVEPRDRRYQMVVHRRLAFAEESRILFTLVKLRRQESGSAVRRSLIATHVPYHVLSELVMPIFCLLDHIVAIQHVEGGPFLCVRPLRGGPLSHVDKNDGRFECAQVNRYPESLSSAVPAQSPRLDSK